MSSLDKVLGIWKKTLSINIYIIKKIKKKERKITIR